MGKQLDQRARLGGSRRISRRNDWQAQRDRCSEGGVVGVKKTRSVHPIIRPSVRPSVHPSDRQTERLTDCLPVCLLACLPVCLPTGWSASHCWSQPATRSPPAAHPRTAETFSTSFAVSDHVFSPVLEPKSADRCSSRPFDVMHCACAGNATTEPVTRLRGAERSIIIHVNAG